MCKIDIELIKKLIYMVDKSNLCLFELETNNIKIHMAKVDTKDVISKENDQDFKSKIKSKILRESKDEICCTSKYDASISTPSRDNKNDEIILIKSSLVGIFYDYIPKKNYFQLIIGAKVKKGQILGIIVYLNIPIEIISDSDGEIIDVCVKEGQMVEYGQTLFKIKFWIRKSSNRIPV